MNQPLIVFDMDGVLVDVTESYRESIAQTVRHFTGIDVTREQIEAVLEFVAQSLKAPAPPQTQTTANAHF